MMRANRQKTISVIKLLRLCILTSLLPSVNTLRESRAEDKNGLSSSRLKLPKGPGSLEGIGENIELNLNMGLMSYGVPMKLPQGYGEATSSVRSSVLKEFTIDDDQASSLTTQSVYLFLEGR
jgi:hypothetical protein